MKAVRHHTVRALDAVRRRRHSRRAGANRPHPTHPDRAVTGVSPLTIEAALGIIDAQPAVRVALVDAASVRLAAGQHPSSAAIADRAIEQSLDPAVG
jgi:hypothetical protein